MTMTRPFQPSHLYVQIRNELARRIAREDYPPGSMLPNEFALASEMQVSVGTVRKALEMLHAEKLVSRSQGRGTVVADRQSADYRSKFDRVRHADGTPISWLFHEILRETRPATSDEREKLSLGQGASVIAIRRNREADGCVIKSEYSRMPVEVFGDVSDLEIKDTLIENVTVLKGVPISLSDERLTLVGADAETARDFGVDPGAPVIRLERIVYDGAAQPIEWRVAFCRLGDKQYHVPSPVGGGKGTK